MQNGGMTTQRSRYRSAWACFVFCAVVAGSLGHHIQVTYEHTQQATEERLSNTSLLISEWIKGAFAQSDYVLRDLATAVELSELQFPATQQARHQRRSAWMDNKRLTVPHAFRVGYFDRHCVITHLPTVPASLGFDASAFEHCQTLRNDPSVDTLVTHTFVAKIGKVLNVTQARRLPGKQPGFHGYAAFSIDLKFFDSLVSQLSGPSGRVISIVDTNHMLVASNPASNQIGELVNWAGYGEFVGSGQAHVMGHTASLADGQAGLTSLRRVDQLPFVVVVSEADAHWQAEWLKQSLVLGLSALLIWGMALLTLRHYWRILSQQQELVRLANTDVLTGVANRRSFIDRAGHEINRAKRTGTALAVMLIDIDHFKSINDRHGHATGDLAIQAFADICRRCVRNVDLISRIGGDEFAVLLPETDADGAMQVAERIRSEVERHSLQDAKGQPIAITTSIGVVMLHAGGQHVEAALALADTALYEAKRRGRNQVAVSTVKNPPDLP